ncbi:cell wall integrity and stress response component 1-like [Coregonus clupeaformis]|uniref:cell wall integrity and stress response component 1-like n=1 Tax=Coregonus clupeaformis TaxID=59861 RepID=UPI001E1C2659|nr:cell wall integrity and stress response component 1-like [Coregonus clupeaformis]
MSTTPTAKMAYQICMEITNRVFNDSLLNPNSEDYKKMYDEVNQLLAEVYGCPTCSTGSVYGGIATMTFRHGSVIANATIIFYTEAINQWVVKFLFLENIKDKPSALQINTHYTEFEATPVPAVVPNITIPTTPTTTITSTTSMTTTTTTNQPTTTPLATTTTTFDKTIEGQISVVTLSTTTGSGMRNDSVRSTSSPTSTSSSVITDGSGGNNRTNTTLLPTTSHGASTSPGRVDPAKTSKRPTTSPSSGFTKRPLKPSTRHQSSTTTKSSTTANMASGGNDGGFNDWVPGWAIALLVLAAVILLLLIIIFIMMVVRWCCKRSKDLYTHERKNFPNIGSFPAYVSHGPQAPIQEQPNGKTFETIDDPRKKNKTGMYIVNP